MSSFSAPRTALFVIDGTTPSRAGAASAREVLGDDVRWSVLVVVGEHPLLTTGATGFAGPVLSPDEMDTIATADLIAGDAAAAETAGGFGAIPVGQRVVRGRLGPAVAAHVGDHDVDVVVTDSAELASPLIENGIAAVLVVAPVDGRDLDAAETRR